MQWLLSARSRSLIERLCASAFAPKQPSPRSQALGMCWSLTIYSRMMQRAYFGRITKLIYIKANGQKVSDRVHYHRSEAISRLGRRVFAAMLAAAFWIEAEPAAAQGLSV